MVSTIVRQQHWTRISVLTLKCACAHTACAHTHVQMTCMKKVQKFSQTHKVEGYSLDSPQSEFWTSLAFPNKRKLTQNRIEIFNISRAQVRWGEELNLQNLYPGNLSQSLAVVSFVHLGWWTSVQSCEDIFRRVISRNMQNETAFGQSL